jgi:hypothetical protein
MPSNTALIVGTSVSVALTVFALIIGLLLCCWKKKTRENKQMLDMKLSQMKEDYEMRYTDMPKKSVAQQFRFGHSCVSIRNRIHLVFVGGERKYFRRRKQRKGAERACANNIIYWYCSFRCQSRISSLFPVHKNNIKKSAKSVSYLI